MYAYTQRRGDATEIVAVSQSEETLQKELRKDVCNFIDEVYGNDEEAQEWLMPVDENPNFWSDEDEEYETVFQIVEVKEI